MQIIRKPPKPLVITLIVLLSIAVLGAAAYGGIYLYSEQVIFDHRDCSMSFGRGYYEIPEGYTINYPFFGNPLALSGSDGPDYALIFGSGGEKNIPVYDAVNSVISSWIYYLSLKYKNYVTFDYTMKQDSKTIAINFKGNVADEERKTLSLEQEFVFDIENASPDNLPQWVNEDEAGEEFKEYWHYINNRSSVDMPEWYSECLKI